ncbi:CvfD/Ygs/GSP13 family RNA-binding post-transcriptional regulator [uncultured Leuconostoc sp.]|uniref:CvfD/Ygs/GSP13 family RNA-binding post-transcriptional regulator n=1 Tax=uncultured Leuconostoc sp. TaxID=173262 RepID=UPI0025CE944E|nr:CvfD/Ygs/GSP13 family RNA-binding post-transcriptional regulator [uncultured Leuconostoc sp.]
MNYHIGQKISGHITGIKPYGAFVVLDDHVQGLIHISECKSGVVRELKNELKIGQEVLVTVLDIEQYNNKISLSLRQDDIMLKQGLPKKNTSLRKHFWTNNFLNYGFDPIASHRDDWVTEALKRISK